MLGHLCTSVVLLRPALGGGTLARVQGVARFGAWGGRASLDGAVGCGQGLWGALGVTEGKQAAWAGCVWVDLSWWAGTCPWGQGGASVLVRFDVSKVLWD